MTQWQPIETDPTGVSKKIHLLKGDDIYEDHEWFEGAWCMVFYDQAGPYVAQRLINPTHWRYAP